MQNFGGKQVVTHFQIQATKRKCAFAIDGRARRQKRAISKVFSEKLLRFRRRKFEKLMPQTQKFGCKKFQRNLEGSA